MSHIDIEGGSLWFDSRGSGPPLLLVTGLGGSHTQWNLQVRAMASSYRCIVFDPRGVGASRLDPQWKSPERYTLDLLAGDLVALLDGLGVEQAHLAGASMGGLVALRFALAHPDRVRSLSLHSTWARSRELGRIRIESWMRLIELLGMEEFLRHLAPWIWSERTLTVERERIDRFRDAQRGAGANVDPEVYLLQCRASLDGETIDRLSGITAPALITAGSDDLLVPPAESRVIHEAIPGSRFVLFEGCAHASFIEDPDRFTAVELDFLDSVERRYTSS